MSRDDLLLYIAVVIVAVMAVLNTAIAMSPDVFSLFGRGNLEPRYIVEGTIWTAMFALSIIAIFIFLKQLTK